MILQVFYSSCRHYILAILLIFLCGFLVGNPLLLAAKETAKASVDRSELHLYQTLKLTIRTQSAVTDRNTDLSPLTQDFDILQQQIQSSFQSVNGNFIKETYLTIQLAPKRAGMLRIPALQIGTKKTNPLSINVISGSGHKQNGDQPILSIVHSQVNRQRVYEQQQMILTIKLATLFPISSGNMTEPEILGIVIHKLDEVQGTEKIQQNHYHTLTRYYALFPQKSGMFSIPAIHFSGRLEQSGFGFNLFNTRAVSAAIDIKVMPAAYKDLFWIPAADMHMQQKWDTANPVSSAMQSDTIATGQPLNYQLYIRMADAMAEQLPPFELNIDPATAKFYPDQDRRRNHMTALGVLGELEQSWVIIPTQPGLLTIPEQRIHWWNTTKNKKEQLVIPEKTFQVVPQSQQNLHTLNPPSDPSLRKETDMVDTNGLDTIHELSQEAKSPLVQTEQQRNPVLFRNSWFWIALALWLLWLSTMVLLLLLFFSRKRNKSRSARHASRQRQAESCYTELPITQLIHYLERQAYQECRALLLTWARANMPQMHIAGLTQLVQLLRTHPETQQQMPDIAAFMQMLDQAGFAASKTHQQPDPSAIKKRLRQLNRLMQLVHKTDQKKKPRRTDKKIRLQPLYPDV